MAQKRELDGIHDINFQNDITQLYGKYKISKKEKTMKDICYPKKYRLQIPQRFVADFMNPDTTYKGLLIYHNIGAGKTCASINIAEKFKGKRKIVVVMPASLKEGYRNELISQCPGDAYITKQERAKLAKLHPSSQKYKDIIDKTNERIDKYYTIYSYNKFVSLLQENELNLKNSLLIIDEVHNMISETGIYYKTLYETLHNHKDDIRMVFLSATPIFDKPDEIALLMNLFYGDNVMPTGKDFYHTFVDVKETKRGYTYTAKNIKLFKTHLAGYVSYYRGAPPVSYPNRKEEIVQVDMSDLQYETYERIKKEDKRLFSSSGDILSNSFFIGTRMASNFVYPGGTMCQEGEESLRSIDFRLNRIKNYSPKFVKMYEKLNTCEGPIFVYSSFKECSGIKLFAKFLKHNGYLDYLEHGPGPKRYAIWSGDQTGAERDEIKAVYNDKNNEFGEQIHVILGSPSIKEGVTLKRVQQVHIMEPYWNFSRMDQIIGRAFRYCSHKDVPINRRTVHVFIYISTHKKLKKSVEQHIYEMAVNKRALNQQFETAIKEIAIDCKLFKNDNQLPGDPVIECGM